MEHALVSPKSGIKIGYEFQFEYSGYSDMRFEIGMFYQTESLYRGNDEYLRDLRKKAFIEGYIEFPVMQRDKFAVDMMIRAGVQNGDYFEITPSFNLSYSLSKKFSINAGVCSTLL
jgi:hypothetical protein